jgi:hypothetical protein
MEMKKEEIQKLKRTKKETTIKKMLIQSFFQQFLPAHNALFRTKKFPQDYFHSTRPTERVPLVME